MLPQLGDFDSLEYAQALVAASPQLEAAGINVLAIGIGDETRLCRLDRATRFPSEQLRVDAEPQQHRALGPLRRPVADRRPLAEPAADPGAVLRQSRRPWLPAALRAGHSAAAEQHERSAGPLAHLRALRQTTHWCTATGTAAFSASQKPWPGRSASWNPFWADRPLQQKATDGYHCHSLGVGGRPGLVLGRVPRYLSSCLSCGKYRSPGGCGSSPRMW